MKIFRIAIVIGILIAAVACGSKDGNQIKPAGGTAPSTEQKSESSKKSTITKEQYDRINNGMKYKEVVQIVGGEGEIVSESGEKGSKVYAIGVTYEGKGGSGSASFVFLGDELKSKSQYGLK
ncbi:DUF3862 domain-containing protein [Paenibacillus oceani]|uniref:DUF3862 domain-containing protein n=1 Tax=Paenibacillus oceani TaxID=2772510 RepID=A0A927GXD3_9BACL|nr:DUF3862 domain-containing protein [Paenibacillus oceani]MBD2860405.1 DUF3862 domain-containing protein [Paenibacillus oceani]